MDTAGLDNDSLWDDLESADIDDVSLIYYRLSVLR